MVKHIYILIAGLSLSACATNFQPAHVFNELRVVNNSSQAIGNVTVRDTGSGKEYSCGDITPFGLCSQRFSKRRFAQSLLQIDWSFGGGPSKTDELAVNVPSYFAGSIAMSLVLEVTEDGNIEASFDQHTPPGPS